jgi:hypothetical protein
VISNFTRLLSAVFVLVALFLPFTNARSVGLSLMKNISRHHLEIATDMVRGTAESFLLQYEIASKLLAGLTSPEEVVICREQNLSQFAFFAGSLADRSTLPPHVIWHENREIPNSTFCELSVHEDVSKLLFGERQEDGLFRLISHTFDGELSEGEALGEFVNLSKIEMSGHNSSFWSYQTVRSNASGSAQLTSVTPTFSEAGTVKTITGVSILLDSLVDVLQGISNSIDCDFLFLTTAGGVVIDSFKGAMPPKSVNSSGYPQYPSLQEIGDFWGNFASYRSMPIDSREETVIDETLYLISVDSITRNGESLFELITVISMDEIVTEVFTPVTVVMLFSLGFLFILVLILLSEMQRQDRWRKKKLTKEVRTPVRSLKGDRVQAGILGKTIDHLRHLQLLYPTDIRFNEVLDSAIANLAEHQNRILSVCEVIPNQCKFCRYLVTPQQSAIPNESTAFHFWGRTRREFGRYEQLGTLNFDWEKHVRVPTRQLLLLMATIISRENLVFAEFDPDSILHFLNHFAANCCGDKVRTAHRVFCLYYLIHGPFKDWFQNPIDKFVMFFAAFLYTGDCSLAFAALRQGEEEDITTPDDLNLELHFDAFTDDESIVIRNVGFLIHLFGIFIPPVDEPPYQYFISHVSDILLSIHDKRQFALLGEFSVRVESPHFSVVSDIADRMLFVKALLRLSDFCPYWCDRDLMLHASARWSNDAFGNHADEILVATFHREHAAKIVAPWISTFMCFHPLEEIVANFNGNLEYWEGQC